MMQVQADKPGDSDVILVQVVDGNSHEVWIRRTPDTAKKALRLRMAGYAMSISRLATGQVELRARDRLGVEVVCLIVPNEEAPVAEAVDAMVEAATSHAERQVLR